VAHSGRHSIGSMALALRAEVLTVSIVAVRTYSELAVSDLRRRVLVTLWQTSDHDPRLDRLVGATSFGVLNVACNKTVSSQTSSLRLAKNGKKDIKMPL